MKKNFLSSIIFALLSNKALVQEQSLVIQTVINKYQSVPSFTIFTLPAPLLKSKTRDASDGFGCFVDYNLHKLIVGRSCLTVQHVAILYMNI